MRRSTVALVAMAVAVMTAEALAQNGNGGLPNGRPFQMLQAQITSLQMQIASIEQQMASLQTLQAQLDVLSAQVAANTASIEDLRQYDALQDQQIASLGGAVLALQTAMRGVTADIRALQLHDEVMARWLAALERQWHDAEARLGEQASDIQSLIDADRALQEYAAGLELQIDFVRESGADAHAQIAEAELRLDDVEALLQTKQNLIAGACAPGWSIRQISSSGQVTCEFDDSGSGGGRLGVVDKWSANVTVLANNFAYAFVSCPSGYLAMGGGYTVPVALHVFYDFPALDTGWTIGASNPSSTQASFMAVVRCARIE